MKKKIFALVLAVCLVLSAAAPAFAEETENVCGDSLTWTYADGVLTISGEGPMYDYLEGAPWSGYIEELKEVIFTGGVTYVGAYAFRDYDALERVDFGDAMYEIGMEAFRSCDSLTVIHLPETFKVFGESAFEDCANLTEIHSAGRFPSFRQNCLWKTFATIYFPADKPWDVALIAQLEEAFHGRIEFLASDGTDPYVATEPEETEAPATQPSETEAPAAEAPAQNDAAQETTHPAADVIPPEPESEVAYVNTLATEEPAQEPESEPEAPAQKGPNGIVICLVIMGVILVGAVAGTLVFGKKRGKYRK